jgi:hypothetical protein
VQGGKPNCRPENPGCWLATRLLWPGSLPRVSAAQREQPLWLRPGGQHPGAGLLGGGDHRLNIVKSKECQAAAIAGFDALAACTVKELVNELIIVRNCVRDEERRGSHTSALEQPRRTLRQLLAGEVAHYRYRPAAAAASKAVGGPLRGWAKASG